VYVRGFREATAEVLEFQTRMEAAAARRRLCAVKVVAAMGEKAAREALGLKRQVLAGMLARAAKEDA